MIISLCMLNISYNCLTYARSRSISGQVSVLVDFDKNIIGIGRTQNSHIGTPLLVIVPKVFIIHIFYCNTLPSCDLCQCSLHFMHVENELPGIRCMELCL